MRRPDHLSEPPEFRRSPAYLDYHAAMHAVGCARYADVLAAPRAVRDAFHADWSERMRQRVARGVPAPPVAAPLPTPTASRDAVRALHAQGLHDREIAARVGVSVARVQQIRCLLKLPRQRKVAEPARVRQLHARGAGDAAIAAALGLHVQHVGRIRRAAGLPVHPVRPPETRDPAHVRATIRELRFVHGMTYRAIRQTVRCSVRVIARAVREAA